MNESTFTDFDKELYGLIQSYLKKNFELNEDQETFNKFCKLRNEFVAFIDSTNDKINNEEGFWE